MTDDWLLWQLLDSAFPSGALAHSGGLEAAYQSGIVTSGERLSEFVDAQLRSSTYAAAPFAMAAHRDPGRWAGVDDACEVFLNNHVSNRASRAQGGSFLAAAERIFRAEGLIRLREELRRERRPGHFAPIVGASLAALGIDEARTCQLLLFLAARGAISSAVRLGIVGPLEGQTIQHALAGGVARWARLAQQIDMNDAAQTSPVLDLLQGTQDRLYSRLFQS